MYKHNILKYVVIFFLLAACGKYKHIPVVKKDLAHRNAGGIEWNFNVDTAPGLTLDNLVRYKKYTIQKLTFNTTIPTTPRNEKMEMFLYRPGGDIKTDKLVVLLPILGGKGYFSVYFADSLARRGFFVLRFTRKKDFLSSGNGILFEKKLIQSYVNDVICGIREVLKQDDVPSEKIGIAGISMGGMVSVMVMSLMPEIRAGVFMLAGGDWTSIYTKSHDHYVSRYRKKILKNISLEELTRKMKSNFSDISPAHFARALPPGNVMLINGLFDRVIPPESINDLWLACGKPDRLTIPTGHYSSALFLPWMAHKLYNYFVTGQGFQKDDDIIETG